MLKKIIVSIHQPQYLASLPFFQKIYYSDKFVILDSVKLTKKNFVKRTQIRNRQSKNPLFLTIPLKKHADDEIIKNIKISNNENWRENHLNVIKETYHKSEYFSEIFPKIIKIFENSKNELSLLKFNKLFIYEILKILQIKREIYFASDIENKKLEKVGHERNMYICTKLNADIYYSGIGAFDYQKGKEIPEGLKIIYQDFWNFLKKNPYINKENFINGLSILDSLFFIGPNKIIKIFNNYEKRSNK